MSFLHGPCPGTCSILAPSQAPVPRPGPPDLEDGGPTSDSVMHRHHSCPGHRHAEPEEEADPGGPRRIRIWEGPEGESQGHRGQGTPPALRVGESQMEASRRNARSGLTTSPGLREQGWGPGGGEPDTPLEGMASHQDSGFTDSFLLFLCLIVLQLLTFLDYL